MGARFGEIRQIKPCMSKMLISVTYVAAWRRKNSGAEGLGIEI
jgi:hypothetical protein